MFRMANSKFPVQHMTTIRVAVSAVVSKVEFADGMIKVNYSANDADIKWKDITFYVFPFAGQFAESDTLNNVQHTSHNLTPAGLAMIAVPVDEKTKQQYLISW